MTSCSEPPARPGTPAGSRTGGVSLGVLVAGIAARSGVQTRSGSLADTVERAFADRGVHVDFQVARYGQLFVTADPLHARLARQCRHVVAEQVAARMGLAAPPDIVVRVRAPR